MAANTDNNQRTKPVVKLSASFSVYYLPDTTIILHTSIKESY